jgi:hypothetical protein
MFLRCKNCGVCAALTPPSLPVALSSSGLLSAPFVFQFLAWRRATIAPHFLNREPKPRGSIEAAKIGCSDPTAPNHQPRKRRDSWLI